MDLRPALQPMLSEGMEGVLKDRAQRIDLEGVTATARAPAWTSSRGRSRSCAACWARRGPGWTCAGARLRGADASAAGTGADRDHLGLAGAACFAVAESWIGRKMGKGGGAIALVLRYLGAFGPASVRDAQVWSGMRSLADAFAALRPLLKVFHDEKGRELFDLPKAPRPPAVHTRAGPVPPPTTTTWCSRTPIGRAWSPTPIARAADHEEPPGTGDVPGRRVCCRELEIERARSSAALVLTAFEPLSRKVRASDRGGQGAPALRRKRRKDGRGALRQALGQDRKRQGRYTRRPMPRPFASVSATAASSTSRARTSARGTTRPPRRRQPGPDGRSAGLDEPGRGARHQPVAEARRRAGRFRAGQGVRPPRLFRRRSPPRAAGPALTPPSPCSGTPASR